MSNAGALASTSAPQQNPKEVKKDISSGEKEDISPLLFLYQV